MSEDVVVQQELPAGDELVALYDSVGWSAYTSQPENLFASLVGSSLVLTARDGESGELVGLVRTVSDGHTIAYIQDILVHPSSHRRGVGSLLMNKVQQRYSNVRQLVLMTDTDESQRAFYESRGFVEVHDHDPELRAFVRIR